MCRSQTENSALGPMCWGVSFNSCTVMCSQIASLCYYLVAGGCVPYFVFARIVEQYKNKKKQDQLYYFVLITSCRKESCEGNSNHQLVTKNGSNLSSSIYNHIKFKLNCFCIFKTRYFQQIIFFNLNHVLNTILNKWDL